jgi:hypothetical protein
MKIEPALFALLGLGCGAADSNRLAREESTDVAIDTGINTCPSFQFSMILPRAIRPGEMASAVALATDPDSSNGAIRYKWTATSGEFDDPNESISQYACTEAGSQTLSVTASDRDGCETSLNFSVECDAK